MTSTNARLAANADPGKSIFASKVFWGAMLQAASPVLGVLGVSFGPDEAEALAVGLAAIMQVAGLVLTIVGRFKVNGRVRLR